MTHPLLDELRALGARGDALAKLGVSVEGSRARDEDAKHEYKAFKEYLAERLKQFERKEAAVTEKWIASTFTAALRKAHIAMRAATNTSPIHHSWRNSVHEACGELAYYAHSLEEGLAS